MSTVSQASTAPAPDAPELLAASVPAAAMLADLAVISEALDRINAMLARWPAAPAPRGRRCARHAATRRARAEVTR